MCYTNRQFNNRIQKLQALEEQKKAIEEQIAAVKADITGDMGEDETIETDLFKIHFTKVIGSRFDTRRFKKEQADIYGRYQIQTETRRFSYAAI